ncbi:hypothetical protein GH714_035892 [Hevea brasiliensis]|uniref:Uncharacterized protein n=1 Tax=Hevea brasiliensis TaxID=3981 RepID=A0A6A6LMW4_HEVBR|nr:hypothetical protein GH714_035892 [Hevea brasiliensis]
MRKVHAFRNLRNHNFILTDFEKSDSMQSHLQSASRGRLKLFELSSGELEQILDGTTQILNIARRSLQNQAFIQKFVLDNGKWRNYKEPTWIGEEDGLIIVDHGSRRKESNLMLRVVYLSELAEPSIRDAFGLCVHQGANRVIVSPFFLFPGRHWHQDIPSLTAEAAKEHPGVSYIITAPLGLHELLVDVVNDRIKHCLNQVAGDADECAACAGTGKCKLY